MSPETAMSDTPAVKLTNVEFARMCASVAREASAWAADLLVLDEYCDKPAKDWAVARFTDDLRRHLDWIDRRVGRALLDALKEEGEA